MVRVAVIDYDICRPSKCLLECIRFCPINKSGSKAIELSDEKGGKPVIYEEVCVGCGICIRKCPFEAISIVNLPDELEKKVVHRYGINAFKLYGLPQPIQGKVLGVVGKNGSGKTTALRILSGELRPNLGIVDKEVGWDQVLNFFRGTEMFNYFKKLVNKELRTIHKIQYVDIIPKYVKGSIKAILERVDERGLAKDVIKLLNLESVADRLIKHLSGGELQRLAIAAALCRDANVYLFDEPSSYLDVKERINAAKVIRELMPKNAYVIVVEHDLAVLDYVSDYITVVFGEPGVYGIFSKTYAVGSGINNFLLGFLPAENMRIRKEPIKFHVHEKAPEREAETNVPYISWGNLVKKLNGFKLTVEEGISYKGEVIGILGPNGIGKTTFIRLLAGELEPDEGYVSTSGLRISYKPQYVKSEFFEGTVEEVLRKASEDSLSGSSWFYVEVVRRLGLHKLLLRDVKDLSGGELQKLAIAVTLARNADVYLLDEPSAYIDVEERLIISKAIRRVTSLRKVTTFVVEHDLSIIDFIANRLIVFDGTPGIEGYASRPMGLREGMNKFLKTLGITFRRDMKTGRPRINKPGSYLDRYQKSINEYYYIPLTEKEEVSEE